jgi:hypothetical protein
MRLRLILQILEIIIRKCRHRIPLVHRIYEPRSHRHKRQPTHPMPAIPVTMRIRPPASRQLLTLHYELSSPETESLLQIRAHFLLRKKPGFPGVPPLTRPRPPAVAPPLQSLAHFAVPLRGQDIQTIRRLRGFLLHHSKPLHTSPYPFGVKIFKRSADYTDLSHHSKPLRTSPYPFGVKIFKRSADYADLSHHSKPLRGPPYPFGVKIFKRPADYTDLSHHSKRNQRTIVKTPDRYTPEFRTRTPQAYRLIPGVNIGPVPGAGTGPVHSKCSGPEQDTRSRPAYSTNAGPTAVLVPDPVRESGRDRADFLMGVLRTCGKWARDWTAGRMPPVSLQGAHGLPTGSARSPYRETHRLSTGSARSPCRETHGLPIGRRTVSL